MNYRRTESCVSACRTYMRTCIISTKDNIALQFLNFNRDGFEEVRTYNMLYEKPDLWVTIKDNRRNRTVEYDLHFWILIFDLCIFDIDLKFSTKIPRIDNVFRIFHNGVPYICISMEILGPNLYKTVVSTADLIVALRYLACNYIILSLLLM